MKAAAVSESSPVTFVVHLDAAVSPADHHAIELAMAAAAFLPLYTSPAATPASASEGGVEIYDVISELAKRLVGPQITRADAKLERCEAMLNRVFPRPVEGLSARDAACERWTPEVDAAYFLGFAVGLRLAKAGELLAGGAR